jgi:acyl-coenzyme A synthetase/AMP-(fatty) acid ligase
MNVVDMIFHWAKARPERPAIIQPDMIITYKRFAEAINSAAKRISDCKLEPTEPIAVSIDHAVKRLVACFALMRCGMTVALIHQSMLPVLREHRITNLIHTRGGETLPDGNNIQFDDAWLLEGTSSSLANVSRANQSDKVADLIYFSSGTTGTPKKVSYTNEALLERLKLSNAMGDISFSRSLIVPGLEGGFGFHAVWAIFFTGRTACFAPVGEATLLMLSTYQVEFIVASARQALVLLELVERSGGYQLSSLKSFRIGGSLVSREFIQRVRASLCPNVVITYGSTEAGTIALASYDTIANTPGAVGFVLPGTELEIVDESGTVLSAGEEGQIRCRTPTFLKNFAANNPGAADHDRNVWFYPGDYGYLTTDGKLCVSGRADDVINRGGDKRSAIDIEETLRSCSGIDDAAVCGVWGSTGIEEIWAGIVPRPDLNVESFIRSLDQDQALRRRLDTSIDHVFVVDRIPRTQAGKIQRSELRNLLLKLNA